MIAFADGKEVPLFVDQSEFDDPQLPASATGEDLYLVSSIRAVDPACGSGA
jgi:hypothetical protein